jgi:twinkle protein
MGRISTEHIERLKARRLNSDLCAKLGLHTHNGVMAFDYIVDGQVWNTKLRKGKGDMPWLQSGKDLRLWNIDCLREPPEPDEILVITEGEPDGVAVIQSGFVRVVSVPNGAPSAANEEGDKRYAYLFGKGGRLLPEIQRFVDHGQIVLAVDGDEKGEWLRDQLALRIGAHRCSWVDWPAGCKDANDVLINGGTEADLQRIIMAAKPMWVDELAGIDDIPERNAAIYETGIEKFGLKIELPSFMVMLGPYGCGKSTFLRQFLWSLWQKNGWKFMLTCLEEPVRNRVRDHFLALSSGRRYFATNDDSKYDKMERAEQQLRDAAMFLMRSKRGLLTPDRFLGLAEMAARRDGVKVIALDPVNELDHHVGKNETHYWANFIIECKRLADDYGLLFIASGHPGKDAYQKLNFGTLLRAIDFTGSANWGNKADHSLCFWRPSNPDASVTLMHHEKSKDHDTMGKPALYELTLDQSAGAFHITDKGWNLWKPKKGES